MSNDEKQEPEKRVAMIVEGVDDLLMDGGKIVAEEGDGLHVRSGRNHVYRNLDITAAGTAVNIGGGTPLPSASTQSGDEETPEEEP
jgi:hypothetical protein